MTIHLTLPPVQSEPTTRPAACPCAPLSLWSLPAHVSALSRWGHGRRSLPAAGGALGGALGVGTQSTTHRVGAGIAGDRDQFCQCLAGGAIGRDRAAPDPSGNGYGAGGGWHWHAAGRSHGRCGRNRTGSRPPVPDGHPGALTEPARHARLAHTLAQILPPPLQQSQTRGAVDSAG
jgi:hypothetical protein